MSTHLDTALDALTRRTGGQVLVRALVLNGVTRFSCVPGESFLPVLDAVLDEDGIEAITCRHEFGAAFMAEAWGKLGPAPGVCFVTRGPGACNASIAVHTARQDSTPLVLFVGQVKRAHKGREAFQEIDIASVFGPLAKWATEIDEARRIPEITRKAFHIARSGRPGPVVIGLPEDMLEDMTASSDLPAADSVQASPAESDLMAVAEMLKDASQPLIIVGGSGWGDESCTALAGFAQNFNIPVAASFRRQDIFDNRHGCYIGDLGTSINPKLTERIGHADVLLVIGARLNDIATSGYHHPEAPRSYQKLIHVHPDADLLGNCYTPDLPVQAGPDAFTKALETYTGSFQIEGGKWKEWCENARKDYKKWIAIADKLDPRKGGVNMTAVFRDLRDWLAADTVVTTDAGNFNSWVQRYLQFSRPGRFLGPVSGAMGYAVPASLAAAMDKPGHSVVAIIGDGGCLMTGNELATAVQYNLKVMMLVCNNNMYGTIRMHQEREFPGRVSATGLTNPDFAKWAESFGALGIRVERDEDFAAALSEADGHDGPAVIEIVMDPEQFTTKS